MQQQQHQHQHQHQHQQENQHREEDRAQRLDLGSAETESGMERRLDHDHGEIKDDPVQFSASGNSPFAVAISPVTVAVADGRTPREAVTLTGGQAEPRDQREVRLERQPMQDAASSNYFTSTGSHGAAIRDRQENHVSLQTGPQTDYLASSPSNPAATMTAATTLPPIAATADSTAAAAAAGVIDANAAESYEQQHVHSVYETIASHFSSTRYKPWPFVASFLASLAPGSVGLDVGCGNGKYLDVNRDIVIIGSDRSANLARLARDSKVNGTGAASGADVAGVADGLALPFGGGGVGSARRRVDFAICIAVVHHLSTRARRIEGVRALLDCVWPRSGKVLVYVWALEQGTSRRGWDEGTADQDQLVPWVMKTKSNKSSKKQPHPQHQRAEQQQQASNKKESDDTSNAQDTGAPIPTDSNNNTYQRYYHLYRKGELEEDVEAAGGEILGSGYEKDNWWVIASPKEDAADSDSFSSPSIEAKAR
ncbi:S-adenosyl-L-methionine-dependent methyltransferase [Daldinia sp. FL1419]|nr:S-adenosyl-L-methionine-dependent methyltransferase [Daldinia sp. FL1419]